MWVLGFEPRFSRPQREVLTTRRYPHMLIVCSSNPIKICQESTHPYFIQIKSQNSVAIGHNCSWKMFQNEDTINNNPN